MKIEQNNTEKLFWKEIERKELLEGSIFSVRQVRRRSSDGREGNFILLDAPDWVTVIPVLQGEGDDEEYLMVEQFRHGSGQVTIEFPAGTVDEGEDPRNTAFRELLEETGYEAGSMTALGSISPNPAFMNNKVHFFLATELKKVSGQDLDTHEQIHCRTIPARVVHSEMGSGQFDNGVMLMALQFYQRLKDAGGK